MMMIEIIQNNIRDFKEIRLIVVTIIATWFLTQILPTIITFMTVLTLLYAFVNAMPNSFL